jgi:hypothetical protein
MPSILEAQQRHSKSRLVTRNHGSMICTRA